MTSEQESEQRANGLNVRSLAQYGAIIIALLVLGANYRQIEVNTQRLDVLEQHGSPALLAFSVRLDEITHRIDDLRFQTQAVVTTAAVTTQELTVNKERLEAMSVTLQDIKRRLDEYATNQRAQHP